MRSVVFAEDLKEKTRIVVEVTLRMPQLRRDPALFASTIPQFLESTDCDFMVALDGGEPCALGLFAPYDLPMGARRLLGVEALCFRDQLAEEQFWIWARLLDHARKKQFAGLCMTERSVNPPGVLSIMADRGGVATSRGDQYSIMWAEPFLQRKSAGAYSAFTKGPLTDTAFITS